MSEQAPLNVRTFTPESFLDELTYRSYAANRDYGMAPASWARYFAQDVTAFESRYQQEKGARSETLHAEVGEVA